MNLALMTDPESAALDNRRRRLLFRATHRGTYENDLMIGGFVRAPSRHVRPRRARRPRSPAGTPRPPACRLADRPPADPARRSTHAAAHPGFGSRNERDALRHGCAATRRPARRPGRRANPSRSGARRRAGTPSCSPSAAREFAGPVLHVARDDARMARAGRGAGLRRCRKPKSCASRPGTACPTTASRPTRRWCPSASPP